MFRAVSDAWEALGEGERQDTADAVETLNAVGSDLLTLVRRFGA